jgi:hypothetical protein
MLLYASCDPPHPYLSPCFFFATPALSFFGGFANPAFSFVGGILVQKPVKNSKVAWVEMLVPTSEQHWRQIASRPALNSMVGCLRHIICRGGFSSASYPQLGCRMLLEEVVSGPMNRLKRQEPPGCKQIQTPPQMALPDW